MADDAVKNYKKMLRQEFDDHTIDIPSKLEVAVLGSKVFFKQKGCIFTNYVKNGWLQIPEEVATFEKVKNEQRPGFIVEKSTFIYAIYYSTRAETVFVNRLDEEDIPRIKILAEYKKLPQNAGLEATVEYIYNKMDSKYQELFPPA